MVMKFAAVLVCLVANIVSCAARRTAYSTRRVAYCTHRSAYWNRSFRRYTYGFHTQTFEGKEADICSGDGLWCVFHDGFGKEKAILTFDASNVFYHSKANRHCQKGEWGPLF
ncbi:hypothetical protein BGX33_011025 [Mortierella sp. NVP41]|nr:hypothetical protein BGX33_011025 [Mortierella sp. NVP41]